MDKPTENKIRTLVREFLKTNNNNNIVITEIKNFTTNKSKVLPSGSTFAKGGFLYDCKRNKESFLENNNQYFINKNYTLKEAIHPNQYGLTDYRGGIIIFSTDVNSVDFSKNVLYNWFSKKINSLKNKFFHKSKINNIIKKFNSTDKSLDNKKIEDYIGAFSIGNFFIGRYISDNDKIFDEKSLAIEINGISSEGLIYLAEELVNEFLQETVLVKDMNKNKIFLVNNLKNTGSYDLSQINKKSM